MQIRHKAAGMLVLVTIGLVWQVVPASQTSDWHVAELDSAITYTPDVAIRGDGDAVAVWMSSGQIKTATYAATSGTWGPALTLSPPGDATSNPRVASNTAGDAVAVWDSFRNSNSTTYLAVARYSAVSKTWATLLELPTTVEVPRALIDNQGNIVVIWAEFLRDDGFYYGWVHEIRAVHYDAATASWSSPVTLSGEYAWGLDAVIDASGRVTVLWGRDFFVESTRWSPDTKTWSPAAAIFNAGVILFPGEYSPQLALDGAGNVAAVFSHDYTGVLIGTRLSAATGIWSVPVVIAPDASKGSPASLAVDPTGNAAVVYVSQQSATAGTLRSRGYLASSDTWTTATDIASGVVLGSARVTLDARGNSVLAWLTPDKALRTAHRRAGGQWVLDAGADSAAIPLVIASDAAGTVHLLWSRHTNPTGLRAARRSTLAMPSIRRVISSSATLTIHFTPVIDATNYEYSLDDGVTWNGGTLLTQSPMVVGGLTDGEAYPLRVRAIVGAPTPPSAVAIGIPGLAPPSSLRVAAQLGNLVTFAWASSSSAVSPSGYLLEGGPSPGSDAARLPSPGTGTLLNVSAPAGVFHVRVRSTAGDSESEPSPEIKINIGVLEPPSSPLGLLGMADGSSVTLAWQNTFGGGAPTGVVLDITGTTTGSIPLPVTDRFTLAGVPPGTYTTSVRAVNATGTSTPSNAVTLTFPGTCSAPQVPANFSASKAGHTILLAWSPPAAGAAPSGYVVTVAGAFEGAIAATGLTLSGAAGPGTYVISVAAANACGTGAATAAQSITIP